ncbi:MAG TPA: prepilin-type N-terminal cleavage/methylation domain-containing protein [Ramlibacter sp.]|jgi:general secretion pathway protein J|nr:prepilin-type N-terminal cleavage/methylation domain-containing protein [Ramlibacter sp.]
MRARGFTLVELLVALFVMALMAALSWRGIDGMVRAKETTETRADEVLTLQVGLQQWTADLDAIEQLYGMKALEWNGRVLRLTRRSTASITDGVLVVGWTRRDVNGTSTWLRWQSAPVTTRGELEQAWQRADQWSQSPGDDDRAREVAIAPLDDWQLFYFRENAWTNPQSSDVTTNTINATATTGQLPDGVRVVLTLPPGHAVSGVITRDWVRPQLGGGKGQP